MPYALTLVSRYPVYDLMRDYLTLSWARFSKDVQSHTLQISKILAHPAPRAGELVRIDASPTTPRPGTASGDDELEVIARFPGGLDFGRGLVDVNFTMWPLFKCLNVDNILTICEIALAPTGRVLFFSRHAAMLGIAVMTIKYLVELRGWSGVALPAMHARDVKIYLDDPGPWILGLATEARYSIRPPAEVCVVDLDINYLACPSPPPNAVSVKQQRERYRKQLLAAFDQNYHPDHSVPTEFKEAFPAGRFRPVCKIQAKRGGSTAAVADPIKAPSWWHSTRVIQAFDAVLQDKYKRPSLLKRISTFGTTKRAPRLTVAEQHVQLAIRKRATAFVDARDDLETKIGRLTRRLNFLMTESDLWRDKFVSFEQYAEKLGAEAGQLRAKIGKEQKETRRINGLYTNTAAEKARLEDQLADADNATRDAKAELEEMRANMERMEAERADMIADVEAQIERALASMTVNVSIDDGDSDYGYSESRPASRLSSSTNVSTGTGSRSRKTGDAVKTRSSRTFSTDTTLAGHEGEGEDAMKKGHRERLAVRGKIEEEDEGQAVSANRKRFSNVDLDNEMNAVDEGITQKSDTIAQKVQEIEKKLREGARAKQVPQEESDADEDAYTTPSTRQRKKKAGRKAGTRSRSGTTTTIGSVQTAGDLSSATPTTSKAASRPTTATSQHSPTIATPRQSIERSVPSGPRRSSSLSAINVSLLNAAPPTAFKPVDSSAENTPITPSLSYGGNPAQTDESDNDFQSAYSQSTYSHSQSRLASPDLLSTPIDSPLIPADYSEFANYRGSEQAQKRRASYASSGSGTPGSQRGSFPRPLKLEAVAKRASMEPVVIAKKASSSSGLSETSDVTSTPRASTVFSS